MENAFNGFVYNLSETLHMQNSHQCQEEMITLPSLQC